MSEPKTTEALNEELLRAYSLTFGVPFAKAVLADLAAFCRASESCLVRGIGGAIDRDASLILEARREVFLRIQQFTKLTEDEILALRMERIRSMPQPQTED